MTLYVDTSVLLKFYVGESDSIRWLDWLSRQRGIFCSSELAKVEIAFALAQKERRGELSPGASVEIFQYFLGDIRDGRFQILPMDARVIQSSFSLALGVQAPSLPLRTLDGLHLATALVRETKFLATADKRMATAALGLGLRCAGPDLEA